MMRRHTLLALAVLGTIAPAEAQTRRWASPVTGFWNDPARWTPADVPDTAAELAVIDRFGGYTLTVPGDAGPFTVGSLRFENGVVTLRSNGVADAQLNVTGGVTLDADVDFDEVADTRVGLSVGTALVLEPGAGLDLKGGSLAAATASIGGGDAIRGATAVRLNEGATADFGLLEIASTGVLTARSALDLFGGSSVEVGALRIASETADAIGELNLDASRLEQEPAQTTLIGVAADEHVPQGVLAVGTGGVAELGSVEVRATGLLANRGGLVRVAGDLTLRRGVYNELADAQRDFSSLGTLTIADAGQAVLVGEPLRLGPGQRLNLSEGSFTSAGGLRLEGGLATVTGASSIRGPLAGGPALEVAANATLTLDGAYSGSGASGPGLIRFEDGFSSGDSIGDAVFAGDAEWTADAQLLVEANGPADHDTTHVAGVATLAGELAIDWLEGAPSEGDAITFLTGGSIVGSFASINVPEVSAGLAWRLVQTPDSLTARVVRPSAAGDYNYDGVVDAADYTVWRDTLGSEGPLMAADANGDGAVDAIDRDAWRAAYGSPAAPVPAVPEPPAVTLVTVVMAASRRSRQKLARLTDRP